MTDWRTIDEQYRYPLAPRQTPRMPPLGGIFDEPLRYICVNRAWWSHISGVVDLLSDPDAWQGNENEKAIAEHQINRFLGEECEVIQDIRLENCAIEALVNGVWVEKISQAELDACFNSGGGGTGSNMRITPYTINLGANQNFTSTSYADIGLGFTHNFLYSNVVVQYQLTLFNSGNNDSFTRCIIDAGGAVIDIQSEAFARGTNAREIGGSARFSSVPSGNQIVKIQGKVSGGTGTVNNATVSINILVFEYENAAAANFVQHVRINNRSLQEQINGVWTTVNDDLAPILNGIESKADAAQDSADLNALNIASVVAVNNTQNSRLNSIEALNITQQSQLNSHENNLVDLNLSVAQLGLDYGKLSAGGVWSETITFNTLNHQGWAINGNGLGLVNGEGWQSDLNGLDLIYANKDFIHNEATHCMIQVKFPTASPPDGILWQVFTPSYDVDSHMEATNVPFKCWLRIENQATAQGNFRIYTRSNPLGRSYYISQIIVLGRGLNPFQN